MAGVEDVEAAVCEHDPLTVTARPRDRIRQLPTPWCPRLRRNRPCSQVQFLCVGHRGAELRTHQPAGDVGELETLTPDHVYSSESDLPGGLQAIGLGGISAGEHALFTPENRGVLFVGDALGTTSYWTHGEGELGAHPRMRPPAPLRKLLDLNFTSIAVGHGEPILDQAKVALATYLEAAGGG